mmetsp:Transcript_10120/g.25775  ORF Transcript_10120/g.25775 Transcript_10120/m.25775 type:complete len:207 (-) Transcript_10120:122-742(-)
MRPYSWSIARQSQVLVTHPYPRAARPPVPPSDRQSQEGRCSAPRHTPATAPHAVLALHLHWRRLTSARTAHQLRAVVEQHVLHHLARQPLNLLHRHLGRIASDAPQLVLVSLLVQRCQEAPHPPAVRHGRVRLLQLLTEILDLADQEVAVAEERRGAERVDPVLVPQEVQHVRVQGGLEVADVQRVVALGVHAKVLDLVERDGLVL